MYTYETSRAANYVVGRHITLPGMQTVYVDYVDSEGAKYLHTTYAPEDCVCSTQTEPDRGARFYI